MNKDSKRNFEHFCQVDLFRNLSQTELAKLYEQARELQLADGEYLFREGDEANEFYILMEGTLNILKTSKNQQNEFSLSIIQEGEVIGEMALLSQERRVASVRAKGKVYLLAISYSVIRELLYRDPSLKEIHLKISQNLTKRLSYANEITVQSQETLLEEYKTRNFMGNLLIYMIALICFYTYLLEYLQFIRKILIDPSLFMILVVLLILIPFYLIIKSFHCPFSLFGVNLKNWRQSIIESTLSTLPLMGGVLIFKLLLIKYHAGYHVVNLFSPYYYFSIPDGANINPATIWLVSILIYIISCPLQEFIVRGVIQGTLQKFLIGKYRTLLAIIISNLIFSTGHLIYSGELVFLTFIGGLVWGWLYYRHGSILGISISHFAIGVWAESVVGLG